ncbi:MAG: AAA family ATPase [Planctomycetota bacterium]|jgi:predicted AAA+ superfamily ATPase
MYARLTELSTSHSFFLFGPRATGKSTLLAEFFSKLDQDEILWLDLLEPELERRLSIHPDELIELINGYSDKLKIVVIDEVQKAPKLLDVVHKMIFEKKIIFALTGSSARKLKRGKANLLAGRAFSFYLHPLTFNELKDDFDLDSALTWGTLPEIFKLDSDKDKKRYLNSYAANYLREEVLIE